MPRSDQAYSLLECSFQDAPKLKAHKTLPRRSDDFRTVFPAAAPIKAQASFTDDDGTPTELDDGYPILEPSPGVLTRTDSHLPPTPPTNGQGDTQHPDFGQRTLANGTMPTLMSNKSSFSTPINQRSPPTPDPSPPRTTESLSSLERPPLFPYPSSSRAESFKTAKEEQSTAGDSRLHLPIDGTSEHQYNERSISVDQDERGLGLAFEYEDGDLTPTARKPSSELVADKKPLEDEEQVRGFDDIPNREWDTNLMRNVTVRRKRRVTSPPKQPRLDAIDTTSTGTGSTVRRSSSLRERVESSKESPHTPSMERFAQDIGWPTEVNHALNSHLRESESRRHSGMSASSTVVEAVVIVTPPQRRQTLRHTGKNLVRRADGTSSAEPSPISRSTRNSSNSDDLPLHRLVHRKSRIPERKHMVNGESDVPGLESPSALTSSGKSRGGTRHTAPVPHNDALALQPAAEISKIVPNRSISNPKTSSSALSYQKRVFSAPEATRDIQTPQSPLRTFFEVTPPECPNEETHFVPKYKYASRIAPRNVPILDTTFSSRAGLGSQDASPTSPRLRRMKRTSDQLSSPVDTLKALPAIPTGPQLQMAELQRESVPKPSSLPLLDVAKAHRGGQAESHHSPTFDTTTQDIEVRRSRSSAGEAERRRTSSSEMVPTVKEPQSSAPEHPEVRHLNSTPNHSSTSQDGFLHPALDRIPTEELPHPHRSSNGSLLHPDDRRKISFDRSTTRTEEHALARHLYAQSTPFSQFSDTTPDALEVSEATAVSIYPHNNHSLLVVQQLSRSNTLPLTRRELTQDSVHASRLSVDTHSFERQNTQPSLTFQPSTPTQPVGVPELGPVDSPLKNPREAPVPPVLKFIPPTPVEELDRQLQPGPPPHTNSLPVRRLSLRQRARRYSDTLIAPLLARNPNYKARAASSGTPRHEHFTDHAVPTVSEDEGGNLHPFWRPRGFWDGFEDSDSDSDSDFGDARLPSGGDTSDVHLEQQGGGGKPGKTGMRTLGRRLTNGFKGSGGFLIGNSLSVSRAGTNRRRHYVDVPVRARSPPSRVRSPPVVPKLVVQRPTFPRKNGVRKAGSQSTLRSQPSFERGRGGGGRRDEWRKGKKIPGMGVQVQYIGFSGVKEKIRERREKKWEREREGRREEIRKSIGPRFLVEGARVV
ncbi:uncharacterized protein BDZ99DRAFT_541912 [Mytilinidion resinicola]|uniref:Uncharacterized protein n=1 Tax=Mytilinidion resinicola TaxID=574789 RepID=A0A6A6Z503_9PEZI|nr:uncharacterized protein BDZ99DRAFT_541912 [Mytilinidion resinicola]KAF2815908.1 hypothetical protein BDZ99DRAFT_541912 [Mytilinidion resinicola]